MTWWNVDIIRKRAEHLGWIMSTRATLIVIAAITAITVARGDPLPVPFTGGNCPFGYYCRCYVFDVARARGSHQRSSRARACARGFTDGPFAAEQHSNRQRYSPLTATSSF